MKSQSEENSNTDSQSELVSELRTLLSEVRTADFDQRIKDGEPLDDLIDKIRLIRKELSPYQVKGERMQAGLRPQEHFFRPDTGKDYDLRGLQPEDFFPYSPIIGPYNPIAPPFRFSMEVALCMPLAISTRNIADPLREFMEVMSLHSWMNFLESLVL